MSAADILALDKGPNPANRTTEQKGTRRARIPMSVPMRKLEVPEIAGFHSHWFKDSNIGRAIMAGYAFVEFNEVPVNQRNVAGDYEMSGSTDLGSHVSVSAGIGSDSKPERLTLMKLPMEDWLADREAIDGRNAAIMGGIFRGEKIIGQEKDQPGEEGIRYVDPERTKALYNRRRAKA
jgi:hypothetical protein